MTFTVPTCPTCRYDLSATPDGRCPECGGEFTHAALREAHERRSESRDLAAFLAEASLVVGTLLLVGATASLGVGLIPDQRCIADPHWPRRFQSIDAVVVMFIFMAAPWIALGRARRTLPLALISLPLLLLANRWFWLTMMGLPPSVTPIAAVVCVAALAYSLWTETARSLRHLRRIVVCVLMLQGMLLYLHTTRGTFWSDLCDPRPGQEHRQYPLRLDEVRVLAWFFVGGAVLVWAAGMWPRRIAP
ncbi:MAG: hypothetical protein K2Q20_02465 [Phycisphaerales bacterium]|nr:hypothetical protein [Phycisphaerales bacterium]